MTISSPTMNEGKNSIWISDPRVFKMDCTTTCRERRQSRLSITIWVDACVTKQLEWNSAILGVCDNSSFYKHVACIDDVFCPSPHTAFCIVISTSPFSSPIFSEYIFLIDYWPSLYITILSVTIWCLLITLLGCWDNEPIPHINLSILFFSLIAGKWMGCDIVEHNSSINLKLPI